MIKYSVDRIEEDYVICENLLTNKMENLEKLKLPENLKEGDILVYDNDHDMYYIDKEETLKSQKEIKDMVNTLFKKK